MFQTQKGLYLFYYGSSHTRTHYPDTHYRDTYYTHTQTPHTPTHSSKHAHKRAQTPTRIHVHTHAQTLMYYEIFLASSLFLTLQHNYTCMYVCVCVCMRVWCMSVCVFVCAGAYVFIYVCDG